MIEADFVFPNAAKHAFLAEFLRLPGSLLPTRTSVGENERGSPISNSPEVLADLTGRTTGFFLKNKRCSYDINIADFGPIKCSCFVDLEPSQAKVLLKRLSAAQPLFGFACLPEEREAKNRVIDKLDSGTIETWVGRNIEKALPGLYWCTLVPETLARKHGVPLTALAAAALEHIELGGEQHLFRFYDKPEDWSMANNVADLTRSFPGIFDIESVRAPLAQAKTFMEYIDISHQWSG